MARVVTSFIFIALLVLLQFHSHSHSALIEEHGDNEDQINISPIPSTTVVPRQQSSRKLFSKYEILPVASWDGNVYGVDSHGEIKWSFSTGSPLASHRRNSRRNLCSKNEIKETALSEKEEDEEERIEASEDDDDDNDIMDNKFLFSSLDWNLTAYDKSRGTQFLPRSPEEFIRKTPHFLPDGSLILGSKTMTTFLVDFKTGNIVKKFNSKVPSLQENLFSNDYMGIGNSSEQSDSEDSKDSKDISPIQPVFVTRTDYNLVSYKTDTGEVQWNASVAEIEAVFSFLTKMSLEGAGKPPQMRPVKSKIPIAAYDSAFLLKYMLQDYYKKTDMLFLPSSEDHGEDDSSVEIVPEKLYWNQNMLALPYENMKEDRQTGGFRSPDKYSWFLEISGAYNRFGLWSFLPLVICSAVFSALIACMNKFSGTVLSVLGSWRPCLNYGERQVGSSKKRKGRKHSNNRRSNGENNQNNHNLQGKAILSYDNEKLNGNSPKNKNPLSLGGRIVGKIVVLEDVIDSGSNGTMIYMGSYNGREVAIKRLVKAYHEIASKEIQNLIASDQHPNIVRWYGSEVDEDFVYVALERCKCNLSDFILALSHDVHIRNEMASDAEMKKIQGVSALTKQLNIRLWNDKGSPSQQLLDLMRDMVKGLQHLHSLGIIHRDLKPQNVLISTVHGICAKLSDMGLSKKLSNDKHSLTHTSIGVGSSGWRAPEQLVNGRQTCAIDLFSLGCVLYFCITGGKHPFGAEYERETNIVNGKADFFLIEDIPEAVDLISSLLSTPSEMRPTTNNVLQHHFFWNSETRLSFLKDASDRIELEDKDKEKEQSDLLDAIERIGSLAIGGTWEGKIDNALLTNIGRYRRYKFESVRDLLRVIRNKSSHYRELPSEVQELLGPIPNGYESYFRSRFPKLLHEVYKVLFHYCSEEESFQKYFKISEA